MSKLANRAALANAIGPMQVPPRSEQGLRTCGMHDGTLHPLGFYKGGGCYTRYGIAAIDKQLLLSIILFLHFFFKKSQQISANETGRCYSYTSDSLMLSVCVCECAVFQ